MPPSRPLSGLALSWLALSWLALSGLALSGLALPGLALPAGSSGSAPANLTSPATSAGKSRVS